MEELGRSWLFAPGDVPERCLKALHSKADQVIWDLEDGVSSAHKRLAQEHLARLFREVAADRVPWVRIDSFDDIALLAPLSPKPRWVVPKMTQDRFNQLAHTISPADRTAWEWLFIIESAQGLWDLMHAPSPWRLGQDAMRLAFGGLDFLNDLGAQPTEEEMAWLGPRTLLPWISRVWQWPAPIDTVFPYLGAETTFIESTQRSRALGFGGRLIIHPQQILPTHEAFSPSEKECQWAETIVAHSQNGGVTRVNGEMVDGPVLERARRILRNATEIRRDPHANRSSH